MGIIKELRDQIEVLQDRIKEIQDECNHPHACVEKEYGGNTKFTLAGNPVTIHCKLCDKKWTTE